MTAKRVGSVRRSFLVEGLRPALPLSVLMNGPEETLESACLLLQTQGSAVSLHFPPKR